MIIGLCCLVAANGAVLLGTWALLQRIRTSIAHLDTVAFVLLRLAIISCFMLVAGLSNGLAALPLGAVSAVVIVFLISLGILRSRPRLPPWFIGNSCKAIAIVVGVRLLLQVWFISPHMGDPLTYHLPKVAEWIQAGAFTREMGLHPHVTFPAGFELIETWWVVFLHHDVLIEMAGVEFLILIFAAVYSLARQVGCTEKWASLAAIATMTAPGLYLNALSCLNDAAVVGVFLATAALVLGRASGALVVLAAGIGFGIKPTFGYALPGVLLLHSIVRYEPKPMVVRWRWIAIVGLFGLFPGTFWYVRNYIWFGNPFYPVTSHGYDHPVPAQFGPRTKSLGENLLALLNSRVYDLGPYAADVWDISGWGPIVFACGLLSLIVIARTDKRLRALAIAFAVSLASVFLLVKLDPWCMRFVLFMPALFLVATARLAERVPGLGVLFGACIAFQFLATMLPYDLPREDFLKLANQRWRDRSAARLVGADLPITKDAIGCYGAFSGGEYLLYRPDFSRRVVHLRASDPESLREEMRKNDVSLLYAAPMRANEGEVLTECVLGRWLKSLGGRFYQLETRQSSAPGK